MGLWVQIKKDSFNFYWSQTKQMIEYHVKQFAYFLFFTHMSADKRV